MMEIVNVYIAGKVMPGIKPETGSGKQCRSGYFTCQTATGIL